MDTTIIEWLLHADPWVEYRTRIELLGELHDSPAVVSARERMKKHPEVRKLIDELKEWPGEVLKSHKNAGHPYHKLAYIADVGFNMQDAEIQHIVGKVFEHISSEGPFQVCVNIPVHFGGTGTDQFAWFLCDAPVLVYSLAKFGLAENESVIIARDFLISKNRDNGYPCVVSGELGKFRGPGRKDDPCPLASMVMLKMISVFEDQKDAAHVKKTIDSLLDLWEQSIERHPYMFYMGTDFRKLKAPLIWYDVLHLTDVLSDFSYAINDKRFLKMVELIEQKADPAGKYTPESVWTAWKSWDFGQKKLPSPWLTFLVCRIRKRITQSK
ncbi:MAG: hypothetical protein KKA07_17555 [Bacteroidetes bacterium]|nr:hypothetical protein [Bacteroidota bacterium]MBU1720877.1 hypothetical protein [Bacteroidota bacterium]